MTAAKLNAAVLNVQSHATHKLDAALAKLSKAQATGHLASIGNALWEVQDAAGELEKLASSGFARAELLRCAEYDRAFRASIPPAQPFPQFQNQGAL